MTGFDYFVVIVVVFSTLSGAAKGLVRSLFSFGGVVVGLMLALVFYDDLAGLLKMFGVAADFAPLAGFILPILVSVAAGMYASYRIRKTLKKSGLTPLDTIGGGGLGLIRAWLFCSSLYLALTAFPVKLHLVERAVSGPAMAAGAQVLSLVASKDVAGQFRQGLQELRRLKTGAVPASAPSAGPANSKKK